MTNMSADALTTQQPEYDHICEIFPAGKWGRNMIECQRCFEAQPHIDPVAGPQMQFNSTLFVTDRGGNSSYCPPYYDQWLCWPETPVGTTATQHCPQAFTSMAYNKRDGLSHVKVQFDTSGE